MQTDFQSRSLALEDAFQQFNQVSDQLALAYSQLEQRAEYLRSELAESRSERIRQLAEKEKLAERLSKLLEVLPAGVVLLDGESRLSELNPAARDLLGPISAGTSWSLVESHLFLPGEHGGERTLTDGRRVIVTERRLDQAPGRILLLKDVTEPRRLQQRLERRERLSAMGETSAKLAHQIRTPLCSALLYVGHLGNDDISSEQRSKFAGRLRERLQLIERQINDMLAFSRGHGDHVQPIEVADLLSDVLRLVQSLADARKARVSFIDRSGGDLWILGNPDGLQGAVANLINNAMEHGNEGVRITLDLSRTTDNQVRIRVQDTGPGVPEDIRGQVFDPFFTTRGDGTGLGLAVVQSVILAHRGRISLDQGVCDGACFSIELPLTDPVCLSDRKIA